MTIPVEQLESAVENLYRQIAGRIPDILLIMANDLKSMIRDRLQQKGIDAKGNALPRYSENELPPFFFEKDTSGATKSLIKKAESEGRGISYREYKANRYGEEAVAHRNYTLTGGMFRELQITETDDSAQQASVTVAGRTVDAQNKLDWNSAQDRIDLLAASEEEEGNVSQVMDEMIQEIIHELGF